MSRRAVRVRWVLLALASLAITLAAWGPRRTLHASLGGPPVNGPIVSVERGPDALPGVDNTDLVAIDPSTGNTLRLTRGPEADNQPVWSPDGTRVAFLRTWMTGPADGLVLHEGLFAMWSDGSDVHQVLPCAQVRCELSPMVWAPDGRILAVQVRNDEATVNPILELVDPQTGIVTATICDQRECASALGSVSWSPDGSRIAFGGPPGDTLRLGGPSPSSIWVASVDGSALRELTEGRRCIQAKDACYADAYPMWSPDGSTIAFVRQPSGLRANRSPAVVLIASDGTALRTFDVCQGIAYCQVGAPVWSPDGTEVVVDLYAQPGGLSVVHPSTGEVSPLPITGESACASPQLPSWSPDGTTLAFIGGAVRAANLCAVPRAGGEARVLIPKLPGWALVRGPGFTWLPAGVVSVRGPAAGPPSPPPPIPVGRLPVGRLAFVTANGSTNEDGALEVLTLSSDGTEVRLTHDDVPDSSPALSPDGRRIAFTHTGTPNAEIWTMNRDGSELTRLTDQRWGAAQPAWSPDGSRIAYVVGEGQGVLGGIYVMNADGSGQHLVARGNFLDPTWGPGPNTITFVDSATQRGRLRTVDLTSGAVHPLLELDGSPLHPAWSPDGSTLAFGWYSVAGRGIYLLTGTALRRLHWVPYGEGGMSWSPDGQWLAFAGEDDDQGLQIYVVRPDSTGLRRVTDLAPFVDGSSVVSPTGDPSWSP